jgi:adenylate cyclase
MAYAAAEPNGGSDLIGTVENWLMTQTLGEPALEELFDGCCARLHAAGVPIARAYIACRILHPLFSVLALTWRPKTGIEVQELPHSREIKGWQESPFSHLVKNQLPLIRRRLAGPDAVVDFPMLAELRDQGITDYLGYVVSFSGGAPSLAVASGMSVSWATDRASGFSEADISALLRIQRSLGTAAKMRIKDLISRNVVSTYLGANAGLRVLSGAIKRGDGEGINAAVWFSDLRNSTGLAERLSPHEYLDALNAYFECTAGSVMHRGGEVLVMIGDAVMAIFPTEPGGVAAACEAALAAAEDAQTCLRKLNGTRPDPLDFGVGLHVGDLIFGNIGVPERLQFTVVGPAANEVARVQSLTKTLGRRILASRDFAARVDTPWESLGAHRLQGITDVREVFAPKPVEAPSKSRDAEKLAAEL